MATEKVTVMVMKVDLDCASCYKKTKKLLCQIPQVRDQVFNEKQNTVTITVVCCSPERIRDKLSRKGGKTIKSIEIKPAEKPKEAEKKKEAEKPKEAEKKKEADKPKEAEKKKDADKPKAAEPEKAKADGKGDKPAAQAAPKQAEPAAPKASEASVKAAVHGYPPLYTMGVYGGPSYEMGYHVGPGFGGYGMPPPPPPSYDGYGRPIYEARPVYDGYGRPNHGVRYEYFTEENPQACTIM